jgi:hypothetical protein
MTENSKRWQDSSTGWVDTMTKSKENKVFNNNRQSSPLQRLVKGD